MSSGRERVANRKAMCKICTLPGRTCRDRRDPDQPKREPALDLILPGTADQRVWSETGCVLITSPNDAIS